MSKIVMNGLTLADADIELIRRALLGVAAADATAAKMAMDLVGVIDGGEKTSLDLIRDRIREAEEDPTTPPEQIENAKKFLAEFEEACR